MSDWWDESLAEWREHSESLGAKPDWQTVLAEVYQQGLSVSLSADDFTRTIGVRPADAKSADFQRYLDLLRNPVV